jgi:general stress protein YciG
MPGNKIGGQKAAEANRARHGKDFYARIGAIGGRKGTTGGFAANRELAREAGRKGGMISRRRKVVNDGQVVIKKAAKIEVTEA